MSSLDRAFADAYAVVRTLPERPDNPTLLRLYALSKQAAHGDAGTARPGFFDLVGQAKHDAWTALRGMPADEARKRYIALAQELVRATGAPPAVPRRALR